MFCPGEHMLSYGFCDQKQIKVEKKKKKSKEKKPGRLETSNAFYIPQIGKRFTDIHLNHCINTTGKTISRGKGQIELIRLNYGIQKIVEYSCDIFLPIPSSRTLTFQKSYLLQWKHFKLMVNAFYFMLKTLFVLEIFTFLSVI